MEKVSRREAKKLIEQRQDLTVIETLEEPYFRKYHLPGARNVPFSHGDNGFDEQIQTVAPDKSAPILVYCHDADCDSSTKAARRLVELGYSEVYDYEAGKVDWKEAGLPVEDSEHPSG
jgi:rhodanese-related sulfurtransferase